MKHENFLVASPSYAYVPNMYRALTDDANGNWVKGDLIRGIDQIDEATGNVLSTTWKNLDTGNDIPAGQEPTVGTDVEAQDGKRAVVASRLYVVDNTVKDLTDGGAFTVPSSANKAEIEVMDAPIIYTFDGTTAPVGDGSAAYIGYRQADGQKPEIESKPELINFQFTRYQQVDARIYVTFICDLDFDNE